MEVIDGRRPGILVLDMSYTLKMFRERQLEQALDSRRLGGYFGKVISVHPLAALFESGSNRHGVPAVTELDAHQTFVEGKIGRFERLRILAPLNFLLAQASLVRLLIRMGREAGVSVVRVGDPYYLGIMGWILARRLDVPLAIRVPFRYDDLRRVTGRATMPRLFRFGWVEKLLERFVFPRCDLIAGANEDNRQYALENGGRAEVSTVFRYGNLLHASHWIEPRNRPAADHDLAELGLDRKSFIATVARLEPMKRVDAAIRATGELVRRGHDIHLLVVGHGALQQELFDLAMSLGLERRIAFAGSRDQDWIARVLPRASVIVSPHMGRALAEAALSGVPIVAFDYDWQREIVVSGETGYLVANGDWRAMADRAELVLVDRVRARTMGEHARAKVAAMMDPVALTRHEQATYTRLIEQWASRRGPEMPVPSKQRAR